jgi:hypothetical protein
MLNNTDKVIVENRSNAICCYRIPETNYIRRFVENERKEIPMGELRAAIQIPGTRMLIKDDLIIHSKEAVEELLPEVEPEYFYTAKDVDFLLTRGTLDQLKDALDFAPEGVVNLIKEEAVKTELNDVSKREAILTQTGFNVTEAIKIKNMSESKADTEIRTRRANPINSVEE